MLLLPMDTSLRDCEHAGASMVIFHGLIYLKSKDNTSFFNLFPVVYVTQTNDNKPSQGTYRALNTQKT